MFGYNYLNVKLLT